MFKGNFLLLVSFLFFMVPSWVKGNGHPILPSQEAQRLLHGKTTESARRTILYLSGKWVGSNGVIYHITQTKHRFNWAVYSKQGLDRGKGKVLGKKMTLTWRFGRRKTKVTGKITGIGKQGTVNKIEWSNGIVFTRAEVIKVPQEIVGISPKVVGNLHVYPKLPDTLLMGDFTLKVTRYDYNKKIKRGRNKNKWRLSGLAWVKFNCGYISITPVLPAGTFQAAKSFAIVSRVRDPATQLSLSQARIINKNAQLGGTLELKLPVKENTTQNIIQAKNDLLKKHQGLLVKQGDILVRFDKVIVTPVPHQTKTGRIIVGKAEFPVPETNSQPLKLALNNFIAVIHQLTLTPQSAMAYIVIELPNSIASLDDCGPVELDLGKITISPRCEFYLDTGDPFGTWIIGNTGMTVEGTGFVADFSSTQSPVGKAATWKGVLLKQGKASGSTFVPENSNIGYLAGQYQFTNAEVISDGFASRFDLTASHAFHPINPLGYLVRFNQGYLILTKSDILNGELQNGFITLPTEAACHTVVGNPLTVSFQSVKVQRVLGYLNLYGTVSAPPGARLVWGELTNPSANKKLKVWDVMVAPGLFCLPGNPRGTFSPDTPTGFIPFKYLNTPEQMYAQLQLKGMAGVTFINADILRIYSPDRAGGSAAPIQMPNLQRAWLHVSSRGINGKISVHLRPQAEQLGNTNRPGYKGNLPFNTVLSTIHEEKKMLFFQFADSAVYDSELNGYSNIPEPTGIPKLKFRDMETTSTANLVGGDIMIDAAGEELKYWQLKLASTNPSGQAGVMSVRTGRIAFTAARISEEHHFDHEYGLESMIPFVLTWGEMLADGNFGNLFLNHNTYGQRFDGLPFAPENFVLSKYIPGNTDGYFDTCGTVHIGFFGSQYVNIRDSRHDPNPNPPFNSRYVRVPDIGEAGTEATNLHLQGEWNKKKAEFDFPDTSMNYHELSQDGFFGTGTTKLDMIQADSLSSTIEIHRGITDICFSSTSSHALRFLELNTTFCGINELFGCIRIEGPLLKRIAFGGYMEASSTSGFGILAPKSASYIETYVSVSPTSANFYAAGDMLMQVAGSAVDISGYTSLAIDYARSTAEGEIMGKIDCNSILGGLSGEGQLTWFLGPAKWYLQGKMKMALCTWVASGGLEGGMFIGNNVPKGEAWVLNTGSEHFGVDQSILPPTLTGVYGYGQAGINVNWYVFGGGVEIYAGMGAFSSLPLVPPSMVDDWSGHMSGLGLPYVLGSAGVHVHGEILGGLVSASAWGKLDLRGPIPIWFSGTFGLEGCVLWVLCASVDVTAGISPEDGFFIH